MKIRKTAAAAAFFMLLGVGAFAQKGAFELGVNLGYGAMAGTQTLIDNTGTVETAIPYSLGAGFNAGITADMMLGEHVGAGIDLNYVAGTPVTFTSIQGNIVTTNTWQGMLFDVTPFVLVSANTGGVNPYGKFGLVLGVPSFTKEMTESGNFAASGTYIDQYSGGMGVGWYGAFGVQFPLSPNILFNAEIFSRSLSYAPTLVVNTQAFDGEQKLSNETFADKIDASTPNDVELKNWYPFGSAGLQIGVSFLLGQ